MSLPHQDPEGRPRMVDVGAKDTTERVAEAEGRLLVSAGTLEALRAGRTPKGDPLLVAQIAGLQAAKKTPDLIPLCHPIHLTGMDVQLSIEDDPPSIRATASIRAHDRTGAEMEALTAVAVALLTAIDMLKGIDRDLRIEGVRVTRKSGGRSGDWRAPDR